MTYRPGNHWGVTIVREGHHAAAGQCWGVEDELVAVVVSGDSKLAERICRLLNAEEATVGGESHEATHSRYSQALRQRAEEG